ncbi:PIN domain-containing protein [Stieleria sp. TO1_6]|uniref:PIN domain-containing protein n=1 Tax=Stieleria tagensis TaxID=2956795 RepID=UPI00209B97AE|nr:PIN domain-containing protein [Stieleria tagensis]MCO8123845.1 PIN domain-containing protein [Stieleria tagensis]
MNRTRPLYKHRLSQGKVDTHLTRFRVTQADVKNNYLLIDLENIQPEDLRELKPHGYKVLVFVGKNQPTIKTDFAVSMQDLGGDAQYIQVSGSGKDALDFHIAFYIGRLSQQFPESRFRILSKDKGFDPLIDHLKQTGINTRRLESIKQITRFSATAPLAEQMHWINVFLRSLGRARPKSRSALQNMLCSRFHEAFTAEKAEQFVDQMLRRKIIAVDETDAVQYLDAGRNSDSDQLRLFS